MVELTGRQLHAAALNIPSWHQCGAGDRDADSLKHWSSVPNKKHGSKKQKARLGWIRVWREIDLKPFQMMFKFRTKPKYQRCYAGMARIDWNYLKISLSQRSWASMLVHESLLATPKPCKQAKDPATSSRRAAPFSFPRPLKARNTPSASIRIVHRQFTMAPSFLPQKSEPCWEKSSPPPSTALSFFGRAQLAWDVKRAMAYSKWRF